MASGEGGVEDGVPVGRFVEHLAGFGEAAAFGVHVDEGGCDEEVGGEAEAEGEEVELAAGGEGGEGGGGLEGGGEGGVVGG